MHAALRGMYSSSLLAVFLGVAIVSCSAQQTRNVVPVQTPPTVQLGCTADGERGNNSNLKSILREVVLPALSCNVFGACPRNPATSCKQIADENPSAPSGDYWVQKCDGSVVQVYCDMSSRCCNSTAGWMRVAYVNMTNPLHQCPLGLRLVNPPVKRACEKPLGVGCFSYFYNTHYIPYTRVCGRIQAYQDGSPDAFAAYATDGSLTLDDNYLDGISLTYGLPPRKHIWSFAAAVHEVTSNQFVCPCTKNDSTYTGVVPPFIGNDYFCDTASRGNFEFRFYPDDPLWDGKGCGPTSECCQFQNPPWFCKELPEPTRENIELRNCANEHQGNEEVALEIIEIYVQ